MPFKAMSGFSTNDGPEFIKNEVLVSFSTVTIGLILSDWISFLSFSLLALILSVVSLLVFSLVSGTIIIWEAIGVAVGKRVGVTAFTADVGVILVLFSSFSVSFLDCPSFLILPVSSSLFAYVNVKGKI